MEHALSEFTVKILFDDSTGLDEMDNCLATVAVTVIHIVYDLGNDSFRVFTLKGAFAKL